MSAPLMFQAITTRFMGPTNFRPARVKAIAEAGTVTLSWDHAMNGDGNHAAAAKALAEKMGWGGHWFGGGLSGGSGNVYVQISLRNDPADCVSFVTMPRERATS